MTVAVRTLELHLHIIGTGNERMIVRYFLFEQKVL